MFAMPKSEEFAHEIFGGIIEEFEGYDDKFMAAPFGTNGDIFAMSGLLEHIETVAFPYQGHLDFAWIEPADLPQIIEIVDRGNFVIKGPIMDKMLSDIRAMCVYGIEHRLPLYYDNEY